MSAIAITAGEPAGIGPDIVLRLAAHPLPALPLVFANTDMLQERAEQLKLNIKLIESNDFDLPSQHLPDTLHVCSSPLAQAVTPGKLQVENVPYLLETLDTAHAACLNKTVAAMVTAPVNKNIINQSGFAFTGHTEYLANKTNSAPVMMLATDRLRVALATTHLPLHAVSKAITHQSLFRTLTILHADLKEKFSRPNPHILVAGLNPHAGEGGYLGTEEIDTIIPVLEQGRAQGMNLTGPLPADTLFTPHHLENADAVLAMYHDQGLPVLKYSGFGEAVNITLGLPIIRTSVDHGTALDIAGTGKARESSLLAAFNMAATIAAHAA